MRLRGGPPLQQSCARPADDAEMGIVLHERHCNVGSGLGRPGASLPGFRDRARAAALAGAESRKSVQGPDECVCAGVETAPVGRL